MENKYERWEPTPLKEWGTQNHLNLSANQLDNVEQYLRELSTHNNIKDGERNWKEYLGEISVQGTIEDENGEEHVLFDLSKNVVDWKEYLNGVEKEQKYYVIDNDNRMMLVRMMDGKTITEADPFPFGELYDGEKKSHRLTEQEIKGYDSRYWPFARPVEELEEDGERNELLKNNKNGVEKEMTKYILATEKDFNLRNQYIGGAEYVTVPNLPILGEVIDLNHMFEKTNVKGVKFEPDTVRATKEDFDENNRYIGESGPEAVIAISENVLGTIGKDLSGIFEGVEAKSIKFK